MLKEMSIIDYNENNVNLMVLLIIDYFIKDGNEKLLIQIHRRSSGISQINLISEMIEFTYAFEDIIKVLDDNINTMSVTYTFLNGFVLKLINGYNPDFITTTIGINRIINKIVHNHTRMKSTQ